MSQLSQCVTAMREQSIGYGHAVRLFRRHYVTSVLAECHGNQCIAATMMGMHRNTLNRAIEELDIDVEEIRLAARKQRFRFKRNSQPEVKHA